MDTPFQIALAKAADNHKLTRDDLHALIATEDKEEREQLFKAAYKVKKEQIGTKVYFRGIIEFSNICAKDCFYCGIRKGNPAVQRFQMSEDEIVAGAIWAHENDYGSIVLQAGERQDDTFTRSVTNVLSRIKQETNGQLGITLSLGEQTHETYRDWFRAGAHRYLLRIETSNTDLYSKLHPGDHDFDCRMDCLTSLRKIGYQVGTGVMIGLPGQTTRDLVDDIIFFEESDVDMIGMGPYIVHKETPLATEFPDFKQKKEEQLQLALKMVAVTRIYLRDINIAATTALQALDHKGREMGLLAGANIIMPNVTDTKYRESYKLYDDKPCTDENSSMCRACLQRRVDSIGESIGFGEWGDSPHYHRRTKA